ncbi:MAG: glycolate oxidase subunit GlcE [Burkholderiaceae bacterium]|nr:glycolate oxidase subunit GlcE [Burkholderiaceae bacterium]
MGEPTLRGFRDRILDASRTGAKLRLRGGGTKDFYGEAPSGELLDTTGYSGIVSFEPTELVITARCGTRLSELGTALAERGQMLACEAPSFGEGATIGGVFSAGLSGPRRMAAGAVRDFVLGAKLLDGEGRLKEFGGQVMKNVAGYDVSRLLCGSLGILGLVTEVSFKVLPIPPAEATLEMTLSESDALARLNAWGGQPIPISASAWHSSRLRVRLSGARAGVEAAARRFEQNYAAALLDADEADHYWAALREQSDPFFRGDAPLWRVSVPSVAAPLELPGTTLIEWGGALRWVSAGVAPEAVRGAARAAGGSATLFRASEKSCPVFEPLAEPIAGLHRRLKREFDPTGVFNPGRMYRGL